MQDGIGGLVGYRRAVTDLKSTIEIKAFALAIPSGQGRTDGELQL
jgi:hypothetical protein